MKKSREDRWTRMNRAIGRALEGAVRDGTDIGEARLRVLDAAQRHAPDPDGVVVTALDLNKPSAVVAVDLGNGRTRMVDTVCVRELPWGDAMMRAAAEIADRQDTGVWDESARESLIDEFVRTGEGIDDSLRGR